MAANWEKECLEIMEAVEMAQEAAMAELEAFGFVAFEDGVPTSEWESDDFVDAAYQAYVDYGEHVCYGLM